jgi:hypothetical protein
VLDVKGLLYQKKEIKNMWLERNETRKNNRIAYSNKKRILEEHGVKFEERKRPTVKKLKDNLREPGDSMDKWIRKVLNAMKEAIGDTSGLTNFAEIEEKDEHLELYVSEELEISYLKDISHAAYCGCDGCRRRMSRTTCPE